MKPNKEKEDVSVGVSTYMLDNDMEPKTRHAFGSVIIHAFGSDYESPEFHTKAVCGKGNRYNADYGKAVAMIRLHKKILGWAEYNLEKLSDEVCELCHDYDDCKTEGLIE